MKTSSTSTLVSNETNLLTATRNMQRLYRKNRAYHAINDFLQFKIDQVSLRNFESIKKCLREGTSAFEKNIAESHTKRVLTKEEALLFTFFLENLTLKHITRYLEKIQENGNELISIRERIRRSHGIYNCNTGSTGNRDDFLYFTLGIGDHYSIYSENKCEIHINPLKLMEKDKNALYGLWVSSHDRDFAISSVSRTILFGQTKFFYSHDQKTRQKTYHFEKNNQIATKTVKYEEEIFSGNHVLPGVAFYFLYLLRLIGGSYRENLLAKVADPSVTFEEKQMMLSAAMDHLLPGWQFPEAKLPVRFSLNNPAVEIQHRKDVQKKRKYQQMDSELYKAITGHDLEKLQKLAEQGEDFAVRFLPPSKPIELTAVELAIRNPDDPDTYWGARPNNSSDKILKTVAFLISNGAIIHEPGSTPLLTAIRDLRYSLTEYLLKLRTVDPRDPLITLLSNPNEGLTTASHPLYTLLTSPYGRVEEIKALLKLLINEGSNPKLLGNVLLGLAVSNQSIERPACFLLDNECLALLLNAGLNAAENPNTDASPLMVLVNRNSDLAQIKFLLDQGADVNFRYQTSDPSEFEGYTALHFAAKINAEAAKLLLERGANPLIAGTNEKKPFDMAIEAGQHDLAEVIKSYEKKFCEKEGIVSTVNSEQSKTFIPVHVHSSVALIVGKNSKGGNVVILGTKRTAEGKNPRQIFPGGYKSIHDKSFLDAAIREAEEETNLELGKWLQEDGIQPKKVHRFESTNLEKSKKFIIEFYLFDVGDRLKDVQLIAKDDLVKLSKYELHKEMKQQVCYSNSILLKALQNNLQSNEWQESLNTALTIETDSVAQLNKALQENNENLLKDVCSHPALLDAKEYIEIYNLLEIAVKNGSQVAIDSLLGFAKLLNSKEQWEKILPYGAKLGNLTIIEAALAAHDFDKDTYIEAGEKAAEQGHIFVLEYLFNSNRPEISLTTINLENILRVGAKGGHFPVYQFVSRQMPISESLNKQTLYTASDAAQMNFILEMLNLVKGDAAKYREALQYSLQIAANSFNRNHLSVVKQLIQIGADPFDYPIQYDHIPLLSLEALKAKPRSQSPNKWVDSSPLASAVKCIRPELIDLVLNCETPENTDYFKKSLALVYAASSNFFDGVNKLVDDGRINLFTTYQGMTAMMHAIATGRFVMARTIAIKHLEQALGKSYENASRLEEEEEVIKLFDNPEYGQMVFNLINCNYAFFNAFEVPTN